MTLELLRPIYKHSVTNEDLSHDDIYVVRSYKSMRQQDWLCTEHYMDVFVRASSPEAAQNCVRAFLGIRVHARGAGSSMRVNVEAYPVNPYKE